MSLSYARNMYALCSKGLQSSIPICRTAGDFEIGLHILQSSQIFPKHFSSETPLSLAAEKDKSLSHQNKEEGLPFKVSYLVNSCGLTPETALSVSERVNFETPERPDSVLGVLRDHGFTKTHISRLVRMCPYLLLANVEKTLLPKLDFYRSIGISDHILARVVSWNPSLLTRSLEKYIVPCYDTVKSVVILDEKVAKFFGRSSWILLQEMPNNFAANVSALKALGVSQSLISVLVTCHPFVVCRKTSKFAKDVEKVIGMGFNPKKTTFISALHILSCVTESSWAQKMETYKRCGWTEDDFLSAFKKDPGFMELSEKTFLRKMDVFVNRMRWKPADVAQVPCILRYSLEKRIIPRCSVIKVLHAKGLMKGKLVMSTVLIASDKVFLNRYVAKHHETVPQLMDIFHGKLSLL